jgi:hypothetical protein
LFIAIKFFLFINYNNMGIGMTQRMRRMDPEGKRGTFPGERGRVSIS